jgi:hypothetical protein
MQVRAGLEREPVREILQRRRGGPAHGDGGPLSDGPMFARRSNGRSRHARVNRSVMKLRTRRLKEKLTRSHISYQKLT